MDPLEPIRAAGRSWPGWGASGGIHAVALALVILSVTPGSPMAPPAVLSVELVAASPSPTMPPPVSPAPVFEPPTVLKAPRHVHANHAPALSVPPVSGPDARALPAALSPPASDPPRPAPPSPPVVSSPSLEYVGGVQTRLAGVKYYPPSARTQGRQGTVMVRIVLDRQGNVVECKIENSSGSMILDDATVQMVRQASPFSPFPADFGPDRLDLVVPVRFSLHQR